MEKSNREQESEDNHKSVDLDRDFDDKYDQFFTLKKPENPNKIIETDGEEEEGEDNL